MTVKMILKMHFQRASNCDCPQRQSVALTNERREGIGLLRAEPSRCHQPVQMSPSGCRGTDALGGRRRQQLLHGAHALVHTQSGGKLSFSTEFGTGRGGSPIQVKSSFGSLIKKQGSQHQGIDFH